MREGNDRDKIIEDNRKYALMRISDLEKRVYAIEKELNINQPIREEDLKL